MLLDLDGFKAINDRLGHMAGDAALRHVADVLLTQMRSADLLARLGGDEFCALLRGVHDEEAVAIAQRVLTSLRVSPFVWGHERLTLTISIGLASVMPGVRLIAEDLIARADMALYETKGRGRDGFTMSAGKFQPSA